MCFNCDLKAAGFQFGIGQATSGVAIAQKQEVLTKKMLDDLAASMSLLTYNPHKKVIQQGRQLVAMQKRLVEVLLHRDQALAQADHDRNVAHALSLENADLRQELAQVNVEFQDLMKAYKALMESQTHLIKALE